MGKTENRYRENVAVILRNARGEILICERLDRAGAWQFPQGGVEVGETPEQALFREVWEEIGVQMADYRIVDARGPYRYLYGKGRTKRGYDGKVQRYFLCDYTGEDNAIQVATEHPEFRGFRWIPPNQFDFEWLPPMKQTVYSAVFFDFFGIKSAYWYEFC